MKLSSNLDKNLQVLKKILSSDDVFFMDVEVKSKKGCLIFVGDIVDKTAMGELILRPLEQSKRKITENSILKTFYSPEKKPVYDLSDVVDEVLLGNSVLLLDKLKNTNCAELGFARVYSPPN